MPVAGSAAEAPSASSSRRHRRGSASSSHSASPSIASSAAREATAAGGSCTPAAPRPAGRSRPRSPGGPRRADDHRRRGRARARALARGRPLRRRPHRARGRSPRPATLLATGGYAALFARTTNPRGCARRRARARLPGRGGARRPRVRPVPPDRARSTTASCSPRRCAARVRCSLDGGGHRFTDELAPRDVVARAIAERGQAGLDLRPIERERFPGLMATLERAGYDPGARADPRRACRALHRRRDRHRPRRRTSLPGLFAAGECAATGVHGANRLASNSLLECLVFGRRAGRAAASAARADRRRAAAPPARPEAPIGASLRHSLWADAGVIRSAEGLERLRSAPALLPRLLAESALGPPREPRRPLPFRLPERGRGLLRPHRPAAGRGAGDRAVDADGGRTRARRRRRPRARTSATAT